MFEHELDHSVRIQTPQEDPKLFNEWANDDPSVVGTDDQVEYWSFYMWNLTNPVQTVLYGAKPHFVEVGPYVYREYKENYNVTFSGQGNSEVSYSQRTAYFYQPDESCAQCSESDPITNIWPTYTTLLTASRGAVDAYLMSALINTTFVVLENLARYTTLCELEKDPDVACQMEAANHFATLHGLGVLLGKGKSWVTSKIALDLVAQQGSEGAKDLFQALRDEKVYPEFGFSTKTISKQDAYNWIYNASANGFDCGLGVQIINEDPMVGCATKFLRIYSQDPDEAKRRFPLPPDAVDAAAAALKSYGEAALRVLSKAGGSLFWDKTFDGVDVGQSGQAWVSHSVREWLFDYMDPIAGLPGPSPLENTAIFNTNATDNDRAFYLDDGVITVKTGKADINEIGAQRGYASQLDVLPQYDPATQQGFFCGGDALVEGHADTQPVAPGRPGWFGWEPRLRKSDLLDVWADEPHRALRFSLYDTRKYRDFDIWRFELYPPSLAVPVNDNGDIYDMTRDGVSNMTCVHQGTPIMFTLPYFARANITGWEVSGIGEPDPEIHYTFIDVDPITGLSLQGHQRLQISQQVYNEHLTSNSNDANGNPRPFWAAGMKLIPLLWLDDHTFMSDDQAQDYQTSIVDTLSLHRTILISSLTVGGFLAVILGPALYFTGRAQHKRETRVVQILSGGGLYHEIDEGSIQDVASVDVVRPAE